MDNNWFTSRNLKVLKYQSANRNNWSDECSNHMIQIIKPNGFWIKEKCIESTLKYKTKSEWNKNEGSARSSAKKNGWLNECTKYMK